MGLSTSDSILALFLFNSYPFWSDSQLNREMWPEFKSLAALSATTLWFCSFYWSSVWHSQIMRFFAESLIFTGSWLWVYNIFLSQSFSSFLYWCSILREVICCWLVATEAHLKLFERIECTKETTIIISRIISSVCTLEPWSPRPKSKSRKSNKDPTEGVTF